MSKNFHPLSAVAAVCLVIASGLAYAQTTDSSSNTPRSQGAAPGTDSSATGTTGTGTMPGNTGTGTMQSNTDTSRRSDTMGGTGNTGTGTMQSNTDTRSDTMGGTMSDRDARGFNADGMRAARRDRN